MSQSQAEAREWDIDRVNWQDTPRKKNNRNCHRNFLRNCIEKAEKFSWNFVDIQKLIVSVNAVHPLISHHFSAVEEYI